MQHYPQVSNDLSEVAPEGLISLDFEFSGTHAYMMGAATEKKAVSVPTDHETDAWLGDAERNKVTWIGHNFIDADKVFVEQVTGTPIPLDRIEDTYILHYLNNADFCSMPKDQEDGTTESRGAGFLDLWSMASLYTDLPNWKKCRDGLKWGDAPEPPEHCSGPCPIHDKSWYNGLDALSVAQALPRLKKEARIKGVSDHVYQKTKRLIVAAGKMKSQGVGTDTGLIRSLEKEIRSRKKELFPLKRVEVPCGVCARMKTGGPCKKCSDGKPPKFIEAFDSPFNPNSHKQITEYFRLGSTDKEAIKEALEDYDGEKKEWLERLFDYKEAGKGLKAWFDIEDVSEGGGVRVVYPRFNPCGTATGRFSSSGPNFQNIPKVGFGKRVRGIIVPRSRDNILVAADYRQLELRIVLWYAFVKTLGREYPAVSGDAFQWLADNSNGGFKKAADFLHRNERYVAKSIGHAANYLEGIKIFRPNDLRSARTRSLIDRGAISIHRDWEVGGGVVGFTGVNLSKRLFGNASDANRKVALEIQELYFSQFPEIRAWHRSLVEPVEACRAVSHTGRVLDLYGDPEKRYKECAAFLGQGGGADYAQEGFLKMTEGGITPVLFVHDELAIESPRCYTEKKQEEIMRDNMELMSSEFEGFSCPIETKVGKNWLDMKVVGE